MNEQQMRRIAEAAFKRQFGPIDIDGINIRRRFDFEDDPAVDVNIVYDDNDGQLTGRRHNNVRLEIHDKTWLAGKDDLGWPHVHPIAKSGLGRRDPATV